jgi:hypothetical protein
MTRIIVLDSGPLGLLSYSRAIDEADSCREWMRTQLESGSVFVVPEIADYEVRRELLRLRLTKGILMLETLLTVEGFRYLPITTGHMRRAAEFWAVSRQKGRPTSPDQALDGDVILAAQAESLLSTSESVVTASTNARHLSPFVDAAHWRDVAVHRN